MAIIITICLTNTNRHYSFMNAQDYIVGIWNIYRTCHCISLHYNKTVFSYLQGIKYFEGYRNTDGSDTESILVSIKQNVTNIVQSNIVVRIEGTNETRGKVQ